MTAYYNEIDPHAAQWLRNLINAGHIAPGDVDERSIADVKPDDLRGYTQCHFFAGIGVWSYALRQAGWSDDDPVWTGSCPCQPFSSAGKGDGFDDERHLWPAWFHLITQCEPVRLFGEQVASKDGLGWLDLVQTDLEAAGYASAAVDMCAAGIGAPHIRQRLWIVAERLGDTIGSGLEGHPRYGDDPTGREVSTGSVAEAGSNGGMANATCIRLDERRGTEGVAIQGVGSERSGEHPKSEHTGELPGGPEGLGGTGGLADATDIGRDQRGQRVSEAGRDGATGDDGPFEREPSPGPTNGHWRDVDWLFCRDGKWRPVESGLAPLVNGAAKRVVRLRGYGNAINAEVARTFIEAYMR